MWETFFEWLFYICNVCNATWLDRRWDYMISVFHWDFFLTKMYFKVYIYPLLLFLYTIVAFLLLLLFLIPASRPLELYYCNTAEETTWFFRMTTSSVLGKEQQTGLRLQRQLQFNLTENSSQKFVLCKSVCIMKVSFTVKVGRNKYIIYITATQEPKQNTQ